MSKVITNHQDEFAHKYKFLKATALAMDESILDADQVENMINFCPTKEEMELLSMKAYTCDKDNLGKCEQFFMELMKVPRVESKIRGFLFKIQFISQVRRSLKLKEIMKKNLYLGNTLNQGTARGVDLFIQVNEVMIFRDWRWRFTSRHLCVQIIINGVYPLSRFFVIIHGGYVQAKIDLQK